MVCTKFIALASAALAASVAVAAPLEKRASGMATFFEPGLGACGWESKSSDWVLAVTPDIYGSGENCGKNLKVTNTNTGVTKAATIVDECPTCEGGSGSLDMSPTFFEVLGGTEEEGEFPITWSWE